MRTQGRDFLLISARLLEQIEQYLEANYIDPESLRPKGNIKYSIGHVPPKESIITSITKKLKDTFGLTKNPFAEYLWKLVDEKGMTDVETYKKAHLDRRIFSKIRNEKNYMPSKRTILAIAIALECDSKETNTLLHRAGYHLSSSSKEDVVIGYFIENKIYDLFLINEVLYHFGFKTLGD